MITDVFDLNLNLANKNDLTNLGGNSFGTSIADYDNDGDYDIFVANHSETTNFFFENTKGQCASYLCIKLVGTNSNKSAIGARIKAKATVFGNAIWQTHDIVGQSGGGAGGQNSLKTIIDVGSVEESADTRHGDEDGIW